MFIVLESITIKHPGGAGGGKPTQNKSEGISTRSFPQPSPARTEAAMAARARRAPHPNGEFGAPHLPDAAWEAPPRRGPLHFYPLSSSSSPAAPARPAAPAAARARPLPEERRGDDVTGSGRPAMGAILKPRNLPRRQLCAAAAAATRSWPAPPPRRSPPPHRHREIWQVRPHRPAARRHRFRLRSARRAEARREPAGRASPRRAAPGGSVPPAGRH